MENSNDLYDEIEWSQLQAQIEANALREFALRPIPLTTLLSDSVKTESGTVNFLKVDSKLDLEEIIDLVVSEPKQHPRDKNLLYSTVLLVNKNDPHQPFLAIHTRLGKKVLETGPKKSWEAGLKEWVLVNGDGSTKRHSILKNSFPSNRRKFIDQER